MWILHCKMPSRQKNCWILATVTILTYFTREINSETKEPMDRDLMKPYKLIYPNSRDEEGLPVCATLDTSPCNLVTNPFFYPFLVTRICRCRDGSECPSTFEPKTKRTIGYTVYINNREQIKFCGEVPKCGAETVAILEIRDGVPSNLNCFCPKKRHWQPTKEGSNTGYIERFSCEKLPRCKNTCGNLRLDIYATYFHCTCHPKAFCVPKSQTTVHINEPLYRGKGLVSECKRFDS